MVLKSHSQEGATYIVDGVPLKDRTPAGITQALNTREPKVLSPIVGSRFDRPILLRVELDKTIGPVV